jgi:enamine deaminase RidA (YjgF/YER057c/UK114 family)
MLRRERFLATLAALALLAPEAAEGQRRKKKTEEELTQVLDIPPEPPQAVVAETARLNFLSAPMGSKGLLSQQTRDAVKWLINQSRGRRIVKIRAFVAGTGDQRRVPAIVSEELTAKKLPIPAVTVVQVGALPLEGAQVALEATVEEKKPVNPEGLAFFSGQVSRPAEGESGLQQAAGRSADLLKLAMEVAGGAAMLRVSCFLTALDDGAEARAAVAARFPSAALMIVQPQRLARERLVECEGVARLKSAPAAEVDYLNPEGLASSKVYSQVARVKAPRLVMTASQLAFRYAEADARLAFSRLEKTLEGSKSSLKRAIMMNSYPLSGQIADMIRKVRFEWLDQQRPPASTLLPFEGLPSMDASFAIEVVSIGGV